MIHATKKVQTIVWRILIARSEATGVMRGFVFRVVEELRDPARLYNMAQTLSNHRGMRAPIMLGARRNAEFLNSAEQDAERQALAACV